MQEFANNCLPDIDLAAWTIQIHSDDFEVRKSAHEELNMERWPNSKRMLSVSKIYSIILIFTKLKSCLFIYIRIRRLVIMS